MQFWVGILEFLGCSFGVAVLGLQLVGLLQLFMLHDEIMISYGKLSIVRSSACKHSVSEPHVCSLCSFLDGV